MGAIMYQAKKLETEGGHDSLKDSIADFAGRAELDDEKKKPKPKPKPRQKEDCVVLGYQANEEGVVYSLVIGAEHRGRL